MATAIINANLHDFYYGNETIFSSFQNPYQHIRFPFQPFEIFLIPEYFTFSVFPLTNNKE